MRTMHLIGTAALAVVAAGVGFCYGAWTVAKAVFAGGMTVACAYAEEKVDKSEEDNSKSEEEEA